MPFPHKLAAAILITLSVLLFSCEYAKVPEFVCDTANPTSFNKDIRPIFENYCAINCHVANGSYSSLPLTTAAQVKNAILNNRLMNAIYRDGTAPDMPKDDLKLNDITIKKIECWKNQGFPD